MSKSKKNSVEKPEKLESLSYLGRGIEFHGTITSNDMVIVDGVVKGATSNVGLLTIGQEAIIEADFNVESAMLNGRIRGNVQAVKKVDITSTCKISGDIKAPVITVEPGAVLNGKCSMITV